MNKIKVGNITELNDVHAGAAVVTEMLESRIEKAKELSPGGKREWKHN